MGALPHAVAVLRVAAADMHTAGWGTPIGHAIYRYHDVPFTPGRGARQPWWLEITKRLI